MTASSVGTACSLAVATFIDTVPDPEGIEEGYILEVFNALGESIDVVTVPKSADGYKLN